MAEGQFNHRLGAGTRGVHDADAPRTGCRQIDVVDANTCTADHLETVARGLEHLGRKFGGTTDDDRIEGIQCPTEKFGGSDVLQHDLVSGFLKPLNGLFIHPIGHGNSGHELRLLRRC